MADIDIERLIEEVRIRQPLYNKRMKEFGNLALKKELWTEVCEILFENWAKLPEARKEEKILLLQSKWKNLRTSLRRTHDAMMLTPKGKKCRKYIYYDKLKFLIEFFERSRTRTRPIAYTLNETPISTDGALDASSFTPLVKKKKKKRKSNKLYEECLVEILKKIKNEDSEIDEDKYFLLSLLPTFKKLNDDQKFVARTEIMNVMKRITLLDNCQVQIVYNSQNKQTHPILK